MRGRTVWSRKVWSLDPDIRLGNVLVWYRGPRSIAVVQVKRGDEIIRASVRARGRSALQIATEVSRAERVEDVSGFVSRWKAPASLPVNLFNLKGDSNVLD
jgi:hypothetical protein